MITIADEKLERALHYLATSAEPYSKARGLVMWLDDKRKIVEAGQFHNSTGTMDERKSQARISAAYQEVCEQYRDAVTEELKIRALREAASAVIDCWRSMNATLRSSNI